MSGANDAPAVPSVQARWFYAFEDGWKTFTDKDDAKLEERWAALDEAGVIEQARRKREEEAEERKRKAEDGDGGFSLSWPPSGVDTVRNALFGGGDAKADPKKAQQKPEEKKEDKEAKDDKGKRIVTLHLDPDESAEDRKTKVEVMEDNLFDVDVASMELFPVFWKGVMLRVVRAHWFYFSNDGTYAPIPYDEGLSSDLDQAYEKLQPWKTKPTKSDDAQTNEDAAQPKEENADEKESCPLPSMPNDGRVQFEDEWSGRIFTQDLSGKLWSILGGSRIIRGWDQIAQRCEEIQQTSIFNTSFLPWAGGQEPNSREAEGEEQDEQGAKGQQKAKSRPGAAKVPDAPRQAKDRDDDKSASKADEKEANEGFLGRLWPSTDSLTKPRVNFLQSIGWSKEEATEEGQRSAKQENTEEALRSNHKEEQGGAEADDDSEYGEADADEGEIPTDRADEPPELVLAIHGIGQKLTDDFDAIDFVYDIERLRNLSKTCANDPALRRISHGKRAQFLPICWRKELSFDDRQAHDGNDNVYGLQDVSNDATIPMVRTIISKVILDVPYYLSRHKEKMVEAVIRELNRVYRLFVKRNPDFEKRGGRVSLICHSLGSALAADILADQPTRVAPLDEQSPEELHDDHRLVFNVKNLFFVGSPNGFFFHLTGSQLIARRGTARTDDCADDAASDEVGRPGCLAAEAVYNCFNATDPVAFRLSATVDRAYAQMLRPISLPDAVPALLEALAQPRLSLSKYFEVVHPFAAAKEQAAVHPGAAVAAAQGGPQTTSGTASPALQELQSAPTPKRKTTSEIGKPVLVEQGSQQKVNQVSHALDEKDGKGQRQATKKDDSQDFDLERLQRAERRFRALNPHGCVDFIYASGGMNEYLDMLSAHVSYWTSKTFAMFILTQLMSDFTKGDQAPTVVPNLLAPDGEGAGEDAEEPGATPKTEEQQDSQKVDDES